MNQKTILALVSIVALSTGCGTSKSIEALGQIDTPHTPSNPPTPPQTPTTPPESKALKLGSNSVPISSFTQDVQTFYYDFSGLTATNLDYYVESLISGCPTDPTETFTLVDYTTGSESVVRDLGRSATIEKPASSTARMKVVVSGLSGCMSFGMSFRIDQI
jgi:hypothetical protein